MIKYLRRTDWKLFMVLYVVSLLTTAGIFPYIVHINVGEVVSAGVPLGMLFGMLMVQSAIIFAVLIFTGVSLYRSTGFRLPIISRLLEKKSPGSIAPMVQVSLLWGIVVGLLIITIDSLVFTGLSHSLIGDPEKIDMWKRALAVLYGGFTEEVLMRFVLMTTVVWVLMKVARKNAPTSIMYWVAILGTALLFAAGHLPVVSSLGGLGLESVTRVLLLNTLAGGVFGYLYWRHGLESAILAHLSTDVLLLLVAPILL